MESEIINIFNSICDKLNIAYQFTAENVQYILNRYGQYLFIKYCISASILFVALLLLIVLAVVVYRSYKNNTWARDVYGLTVPAGVAIGCIALFTPIILAFLAGIVSCAARVAFMPDVFAAEKIIETIIY